MAPSHVFPFHQEGEYHSLSLPVELIFAIIEHLHDDPNSLKSFALTSKNFLGPSRAQLFYSFQCLYFPVKELVQDAATVLQKYYRLNNYMSASPQLANCIKHLIIYRAEASHAAWKHVEPILLHIMLRLCNVTYISLQIFDWESISEGFRAILRWIVRQPSVRCISFQECKFPSVPTLTSLILESSYIKRVEADALTFASNQHDELEASYTQHLPGLKSLSLESLHLGHRSSSLAQILVPNIRRLSTLSLTQKASYAGVSKLPLHYLKTLEISVCGSHGNTLPLELLDPAQMPQLQHLHFKDVLESEGSSPVPGMMKFLKDIAAFPSLQTVNIALHVYSPLGTLTWVRWKYIDRALASEHLPELRKVHISVTGDADDEELLRLANMLPLLCQRRILWIDIPIWV